MNTLAVLIWVAVVVSSLLLLVHARSVRRGPGGSVHDLSEVAFLNGGPARVVDTALAAMREDGRIQVGGPGIVAVVRPVARDHVERAVLHELAAAPNGALHTLRLAVMRNPAVQEIGDGLAARGLMVAPADRRTGVRWATAQGLVCLALFPVSMVITFWWMTDAERGGDVFFVIKVLPALVAGALFALFCGGYAAGRITAAGRRAAADYHRDHVYHPDAGHMVALRGLRAVPDPALRAQLMTAAAMSGQSRGGGSGRPFPASSGSSSPGDVFPVVVWCASSGGGSSCGAAGGPGGGGSSSGGGGGGSSCGGASCGAGGGSGCGSSGGGGSSCGSSGGGGSSCGSSSGGGSSCGSSSGGGSSCGGSSGGGSSCGGSSSSG